MTFEVYIVDQTFTNSCYIMDQYLFKIMYGFCG